ncbi:MAG: tRNA pseudouridine(13) synthase TruD [Candidatus Odinarchaeia archaeon]
MNITDFDEKIGIGFFGTKSEGVKGKLRRREEDFIVEEIDREGHRASLLNETKHRDITERGKYIHFILIKKRLDTLEAIRLISRIGKIPLKFLTYAGMKDKNALTAQWICTYKSYYTNLKEIKDNRIKIKDFKVSSKRIEIGDLWGNHFKINIRDLNNFAEDTQNILKVVDEIKKIGGVPNFYGYQRFGVKRSLNHIIGKLIIKRDIKTAVLRFLCDVGEFESEKNKRIRNEIKKMISSDKIDEKIVPHSLIYERIILKHLRNNKDDYLGALLKLPKNLIKLFIHAYQSYLFNRFLTGRYENNIGITDVNIGDIVYCGSNDFDKFLRVDEDNFYDIKRRVKKGEYRVVYPVIGYDSHLPSGKIGSTLKKILKSENIDKSLFYSDEVKLSSPGSYRPILCRVYEMKTHLDEHNNVVEVSFSLEKGCYATVVLREILKKSEVTDF